MIERDECCTSQAAGMSGRDRGDRDLSSDTKNVLKRPVQAKISKEQVPRGTIRNVPRVPQNLKPIAGRNNGEALFTRHPSSRLGQVQQSPAKPRVGRPHRPLRAPQTPIVISSLSRRRRRAKPQKRDNNQRSMEYLN